MAFLFADKAHHRIIGMVFKTTREEKDFLIQQAKMRGISILSLIRLCLRAQLTNNPEGKK